MKQLLIIALLAITCTANAQVGIGTSSAAASAQLDITSTTKGFLPPRMTGAQRDLIGSAATGLLIYCINCGSTGEPEYYNGSNWVNMAGGTAAVPFVTNPTTTKTWMDRNLGATQVASSSTDAAAYGDLYQWGRGTDGHQSRTSATTNVRSTTDQPGNDKFITPLSGLGDWRSTQNDNLWQGVSGVNNPCPTGYRLPTNSELSNEMASWGTNQNSIGAFGSMLKLPMAGLRMDDGNLIQEGLSGAYWSSTVNSVFSMALEFSSVNSSGKVEKGGRSTGYSVRCIKN